MKIAIITCCLIGAVLANPIPFTAESSEANTTESLSSSQSLEKETTELQQIFVTAESNETEENMVPLTAESNEVGDNSTESVSASQSSENDTSEIQSSEESESLDTTSEESSEESESQSQSQSQSESNSESEEDNETLALSETRDDTMDSEENLRQSWIQRFANVLKVHSAEDNSSAEAQAGPALTPRPRNGTLSQLLLANITDAGGEDASDSSQSSESSQSSQSSESSQSSQSTESNGSQMQQLSLCANGTQSCESHEYEFHDIGDDVPMSNLLVPEEEERELSLRK